MQFINWYVCWICIERNHIGESHIKTYSVESNIAGPFTRFQGGFNTATYAIQIDTPTKLVA